MKDAPPQTPIPTPPDGSPPDDTLTPHDGTPPRIAPPRGPPPPWKEAPGISAHRPAMREKEDNQGQPRTTSEARGKICSCTNPRKGEKGPKQGAKHGPPGNRGYYSLGKPGAPPQKEGGGRWAESPSEGAPPQGNTRRPFLSKALPSRECPLSCQGIREMAKYCQEGHALMDGGGLY